jgi:5-methylcytosine-specific restriction endonuclease McrA
MECGHVEPHYKGGGIDIPNLEPICKQCNSRMGIMNLETYKKGLVEKKQL